jgi:hypothetical protein
VNLSKLLWGSGGKGLDRERAEAERAELREPLGVTDRTALKSSTVRNRFEHFDQRLIALAQARRLSVRGA